MLRERILLTLDKLDDIDQRKLSRVANLNESSISRYLNGFEEINFEAILRIVKFLYPEEEREIIAAYIPTQKSKNARYALEYCVMNQLWDLMEELIEMLSVSSNPVDKEWAAMYQLLLLRKEKLLSPMEQLDRIETFKPKELEMHIMKSILKAYIYSELQERYAIFLHIEGTDELIKSIKSTFIKDSFTIRLSLIMSYICLFENNLEESREYSNSILKQDFFENVKYSAYNCLGYSYMFEDYQKSISYFNKVLDFKMISRYPDRVKQTNLNISFLKSHWGVDFEFTESIDDQRTVLNYIYYLIKKGEVSLAEEYIGKVIVEELPESDTAFFYYYKGLLTNDISTYYSSVECFLNLNDYFHLQLPLLELQKLGENEVVLRILSSKRRK